MQLVIFKKMLLKDKVKGEHCFCGYTGFLVNVLLLLFFSAVSPASDQTLCLIEQSDISPYPYR